MRPGDAPMVLAYLIKMAATCIFIWCIPHSVKVYNSTNLYSIVLLMTIIAYWLSFFSYRRADDNRKKMEDKIKQLQSSLWDLEYPQCE